MAEDAQKLSLANTVEEPEPEKVVPEVPVVATKPAEDMADEPVQSTTGSPVPINLVLRLRSELQHTVDYPNL